jgi:4-alpha-glucanotransferase
VALDDALRNAAERSGIQQEFWDIFGHRHITGPEVNRAILTAMGVDCSSEESLRKSLDARERDVNGRRLPPVMVVSESIPLRIPGDHDLKIETEQGEFHQVRVVNGELQADLKLGLGYYVVSSEGSTMQLIVTPDKAWTPAPGRYAGLGVMLFGLRSHRNWGCGDFRDLRDLIDWAAPTLHADFIALNPLHAIHNRQPYNASPYLPNSIYYRNFIYLDVEGVPGFDRIRHRWSHGDLCAELVKLRASEFVQYEQVAAAKRRALDAIFETNPPGRDCEKWIEAEGDLLRLFATYSALDEVLHAANPDLWVWPDWPTEYRDPESPAVKRFAEEYKRQILFHGWVQWLIDCQLRKVQEHAHKAGMRIGLYHDLALATDRCGSDLWAHRRSYVAGCRVGSPPDDFSPTGQDWSFPPPNAAEHRLDGYRLFRESIRKSMRHGGALRIDHVMRLFRLYWVPEGYDAAHGAYVRERGDDLVRILALESIMNKSVIVGEDLGTVEPQVRETLARFGILSYRLLYFERQGERFKAPGEYPAQSLVSTTTHDLATIAGFWTATDIEARLKAGTIDRSGYDAQKADRIRDKQHLLDALFAAGLMPDNHTRSADSIPELTPELHHAIAGYLARTPSVLWLVNQEDLTRERFQQNLPGTTAEYPNWSHKMRWSIKDLTELRVARDCATMVAAWVDATGRNPLLHLAN